MKRMTFLVLALCLTACATAAQRQANTIKVNTEAVGAELTACMVAAYDSPDEAPLRRHIPAPGTTVSLEQLTDANLATDEEIQAIYRTHPAFAACRSAYLQRISPVAPTIAVIYAQAYGESEDELVVLIQKKETWGDYAKHAKARTERVRAQITAEAQRIDAGLERSREAELARRQQASEAILQYSASMQMINAMQRPVVTTCTGTNTSAACISQ